MSDIFNKWLISFDITNRCREEKSSSLFRQLSSTSICFSDKNSKCLASFFYLQIQH